jgi:hypothetical protein
MKLIDNWRQWPRMYSQWAFTTIAGIQGSVLAFVAPDILAAPVLFLGGIGIPAEMTWGGAIAGVTAFLAVTGFVGRLIAQDLPPAA